MNLHEGIFHLLSWLVFCRFCVVRRCRQMNSPLFYSTTPWASLISTRGRRPLDGQAEKCCFMSICSVDELIVIRLVSTQRARCLWSFYGIAKTSCVGPGRENYFSQDSYRSFTKDFEIKRALRQTEIWLYIIVIRSSVDGLAMSLK